jgi:hypothetical protein
MKSKRIILEQKLGELSRFKQFLRREDREVDPWLPETDDAGVWISRLRASYQGRASLVEQNRAETETAAYQELRRSPERTGEVLQTQDHPCLWS